MSQSKPARIGLISCTKTKLPHAAPAGELYMGSTLFRGQRAHVERTCDRWFVLSAKYGLLDPSNVIEPYEQTLKTAPVAERRSWSRTVVEELERELGVLEGLIFECHAGSPYLDHGLVDGLLKRGAAIERPTKGLSFGRQLAFYMSMSAAPTPASTEEWAPSPPRPDYATPVLPPAPHDPLGPQRVARALVEYGRSLDTGQLVAIGPDPDADALIRDDGFAFLLAVIFDQGIKFERAWRAPLELKLRLGTLDPAALVADPEAVRRAVAHPPALHRYVNNMPTWVVAAAHRVLTEYDGDAERIWNECPTAEQLRERLEAFTGIGQKKAAMAVEILERQRGTEITHLEGSDIAFDVHVRRVFLRTGMAELDDQRHMIEAARILHPDRPGELDYPAWWVGHEWCRPSEPLCDTCPLTGACPKLIAQAIGVSSS